MSGLRVLATDVGFSEGPVVSASGEIFFTSIDHATVYRAGADGAEVVARVGGGANGAAIDADDVLYIAQNGGRWAADGPAWRPDSVGGVQTVGPSGEVHWLTREPLSPNDLCFGPDGMLYVTDPTRAPRSATRPVDGRTWRVDPRDGATELLLSVPWFANGIAFGPDDRLYVAATHTAAIHRFDVTERGLENETVVIRMRQGGPDGFAFDAEGHIVTSAIAMDGGAGTIQTWTVGGELLSTYEPGTGAMYTNVAFAPGGGLLVTDSSNGRLLLVEDWPSAGLPLHPLRGA